MTIMKRAFRFFAAAIAATAAAASCQQENLEPEVQEQETVQVKVTIGEQTKGFTDLEGITWEVGDQIRYAGVDIEILSDPLTAEKISDGGHTAEFVFPASLNEVDRTGWFYSTKCHPNNKNEVEFTIGNGESGNTYSQSAAGVMNSRYLFLHSGLGTIEISKDVAPEISMDIAGSIFRILPYTSKYNDESVKSVQMLASNNIVGTVRYFRNEDRYEGVNQVNYAQKNLITVSLDSPFSLNGVVSAENSKGIYLAVAATPESQPLNGYKYIVTTDKAIYSFDAMEKTLAVKENCVKNILLNLDKAERVVESDIVGYVYYDGNPQTSINLPPTAGATGSIGYTVARVCDLDGKFNDQPSETKGVHDWLYNAQVTYLDENGNTVPEAQSWVRAGFMENQICHWMLEYDANPGARRTMTVILKLLAPENHLTITANNNLTPKTFVYKLTVTQNEKVTANVNDIYTEVIPSSGGTFEVGTLALNGISTDILSRMAEYGITLNVNGEATISVDNNGKLTLVAPENNISIGKTYTFKVVYGSEILYTVEYKQQAGTGAIDLPTISYIYGAWQSEANIQNLPKAPTGITAWGVVINEVTSDGVNLGDLTSDDTITKIAIIQQTLCISVDETLTDGWVKFEVEGGFGEVKILLGAEENTTGERRTKQYDVYNADGSVKGTLTVNQDA